MRRIFLKKKVHVLHARVVSQNEVEVAKRWRVGSWLRLLPSLYTSYTVVPRGPDVCQRRAQVQTMNAEVKTVLLEVKACLNLNHDLARESKTWVDKGEFRLLYTT